MNKIVLYVTLGAFLLLILLLVGGDNAQATNWSYTTMNSARFNDAVAVPNDWTFGQYSISFSEGIEIVTYTETSDGVALTLGIDPALLPDVPTNLDDAYNNSPSDAKAITVDDGTFTLNFPDGGTLKTIVDAASANTYNIRDLWVQVNEADILNASALYYTETDDVTPEDYHQIGFLSTDSGTNKYLRWLINSQGLFQGTAFSVRNYPTNPNAIHSINQDVVNFNEQGTDIDFRVEGDAVQYAFGVDAGDDFAYADCLHVGSHTGDPGADNIRVDGDVQGGITFCTTYEEMVAADDDGVLVERNLQDETVNEVDLDGQLAHPRQVTIFVQAAAEAATADIQINGIDSDGNTVNETESFSLGVFASETKTTDIAFTIITSVVVSNVTGAGGKYTVGWNDTVGFPNFPWNATTDVFKMVYYAGITSVNAGPADYTINVTYGTIKFDDVQAIAAGDAVSVFIRPFK